MLSGTRLPTWQSGALGAMFAAMVAQESTWVARSIAPVLERRFASLGLASVAQIECAVLVLCAVVAVASIAVALGHFPAQFKRLRGQQRLMRKARKKAKRSRSLKGLDWRDFEHLVGQLFQEKGYEVEVNQGTKDGGVDLLLRGRMGARMVVQCKHWRNNVGVATVREMAGSVQLYGADQGAIACSGRFTSEARKEAESLKILLLDGQDIQRRLGSRGARKGRTG